MNITFQQKNDPELAPTETQSQSRLGFSDFSEARHQLMADCMSAPRDKATRPVQASSARRQVLSGSSEWFEQAFYWFLTAPALAYVVYIAFGF